MTSSRLLYGSTVFFSALLLFLVEPMAAKELLPALGGSSAVWLTCLVFFQVALLLGYLYAHGITQIASVQRQRSVHLGVLAAAVGVVAVASRFPVEQDGGAAHPVATIFRSLTLSIGLPFLLLGSTSPLLQMWMARGGGEVPYRLFALSNAGSLLALAAYPTLVEPHLTLQLQRMAWSAGFVVYAMLCAAVSFDVKKSETRPIASQMKATAVPVPRASLRDKALWFLLPMGAAIQLSAVTSHLTSNIAAIPLLWMMPLAVYLLTFIMAFDVARFYRRGVVVRFLVLMLASLGYALSKTDASLPVGLGIFFFLIDVLVACLFFHAEVFALRPRRSSEATLFYLLIAGGGVAGSFFVAIASPLLFAANYDLAIAFFLTALLALVVTWSDGWAQRLLWLTGSLLLFALLIMLHMVYGRQTLLEARNFYGSLRVKQMSTPPEVQPVRMLMNGMIQHGTQLFAAGLSGIPTTYYAQDSGVGLALEAWPGARRVGIVGLGVGTLAAYGRPGDAFRFYELNPLVRPIAQNLFTYLRDATRSGTQISFGDGDARGSLARESPHGFQVLVVDAFSGDAIPLHLLTAEAMQVYRRQLAPNGILAFHVSNQYLDLAPEIALLADVSGMEARRIDSPPNETRGEYQATWVLVTEDRKFLEGVGTRIAPVDGLRVWTDDYSSLLPILRWGRH